MPKILLASFILLFNMGCTADIAVGEEGVNSAPVATELSEVTSSPGVTDLETAAETPASLDQVENRYVSEQLGFAFTYPEGYVVVDEDESPTGGGVAIMHSEDVDTPEPPFIYVSIVPNPDQLSLEAFQEKELGYFVINTYDNRIVAGQPALDFESAGLYESRHHLFSTPDGQSVVLLSATYVDVITETDPYWQAAQVIRDSLTWLN